MRTHFFAALLALVTLAGCRTSTKPDAQSASSSDVKVYHMRGKIVSTDVAHGIVVVDHEAIPGFMDAMTMPYQLKDPTIATDLHPGDTITADVLVSKTSAQTVVLDDIDVIAQGRPDYKPKILYHVPSPGDSVPDFRLRNELGREIHLQQFRGKNLLITFIYTRCPLPNFCPLITRNFAAINTALQKEPKLYQKTHLLCVSFDPEHDTPATLRAYGAAYLGSNSPSAFSHLEFAVPPKDELAKMAQYFDVGMSAGPNGTITHTLSTTLINAKGKVVQFYPDNTWTPQQVLGDLNRLEAQAG